MERLEKLCVAASNFPQNGKRAGGEKLLVGTVIEFTNPAYAYDRKRTISNCFATGMFPGAPVRIFQKFCLPTRYHMI